MISTILGAISGFVLFIIGKAGYFGVFLLMFFQSFNIPIPSEITMPFSGFLASRGVFNFWLAVFSGTLGNIAGAYMSYRFASLLAGNGWRQKYGIVKILISDRNLELAEKWFARYGKISVFFGRMIPVVSSFISFPAGLSKMNSLLFLSLTAVGSFIWSYVLTKLGFVLGQNWIELEIYFRKFDYLILIIIIGLLGFWLYRHLKDKN